MRPETILGLSSADVSLGSLFLSVVSACITVLLAWETRFRPPKLVGTFPYIIIWTFFAQQDGKPSEWQLVPSFWFSNVGARPMLVEDLRLVICLASGSSFLLYPTHTIPSEAINSPNTFSDYAVLSAGLAPFGGFAIGPSERWTSFFSFTLSQKEHALLNGSVKVSVEVKIVGEKRYRPLLSDVFMFDHSSFDWLSWAGVGGPEASYFYSSALGGRKNH